MNPIKAIALLLFLFGSLNYAKADQWEDPSWREMLDSSDVIALVKYTAHGDFRAPAEVLRVYKGTLKPGAQIWIGGFSGRYGPYDSVSKGEVYLVFLHHYNLKKKDMEYWHEQVQNKPELLPYVAALKEGKSYFVWTPTSGDLKVKGNKVQYDLLQTTYYTDQPYYPLPEFERFLEAALYGKGAIEFYQKPLNQVKSSNPAEQTAQALMMLYLTKYSNYQTEFEKLKTHKDPSTRFALAKLMGNIKTGAARKLLIELLKDQNAIVQGEAVRQLAHESPEFIGPILLNQLAIAGKGIAGPSNIMDPVTNTLNGGQIEIIETLGRLKYKAAGPALLPLLDTEDQYLFELIITTLKELGNNDYIPYLNMHLEKRTVNLTFTICQQITEDSLYQCIPSLMNYITSHDRSKHPSREYTISPYLGLAYFRTDTVQSFLVQDFLNLLTKNIETGFAIDNKLKWVEEYIETFQKLGIDSLKPYLYDFLYEYYGLNQEFKNNTSLFLYKKQVEDSLTALAIAALPKDSVVSVKTMAFLAQPPMQEPSIADYVLKYDVQEGMEFEQLNKLLEKKGIPENKLIASSGSFSVLYAKRSLLNFDEGIMRKFLSYVAAYPDMKDIAFMENLEKYGYPESDYEKRKLKEWILTAKETLK